MSHEQIFDIVGAGYIASNLERLFGEFFTATYNEHRGPIQLIHQIARVRSSELFEENGFYRAVLSARFNDRRQFDPFTSRIYTEVDNNLQGWKGYVIGRKVELMALKEWNSPTVNMGDLVWAIYLTVQTNGSADILGPLEAILREQAREDDNIFYYQSEFRLDSFEGQTIRKASNRAIELLKAFS